MAGDCVGDIAADFDFLKNLDADLFGGGCCGGEGGEPLKVTEEGKRGRMVEVEGDCVGDSVSLWGNRMGEEN